MTLIKRTFAALLLVVLSLTPAIAQGTFESHPATSSMGAGDLPLFATTYNPAQTVVTILPVADETPDKAPDLQKRFILKAQQELSMRFAERGFKITSDTDVVNYLDAQKIDMNDQDNWNRRTLFQIGKDLHSNLVVFLDIVKTESKWHGGTLIIDRKREGNADLKMWLVDADRQEAILSGAKTTGKSAANDTGIFLGGGLFNQFGGSEFTIRAIGNGTKDLLKPFLAAYPIVQDKNAPIVVPVANDQAVSPTEGASPPAATIAPTGPQAGTAK